MHLRNVLETKMSIVPNFCSMCCRVRRIRLVQEVEMPLFAASHGSSATTAPSTSRRIRYISSGL